MPMFDRCRVAPPTARVWRGSAASGGTARDRRVFGLALLGLLGLSACVDGDGNGPLQRKVPELAATEPAQAVTRLVDDLRRDDLIAYARHAVPPALHARLDTAWREDRSRWPLTQLPLHDRLPGLLTLLAVPGAEKALLSTHRRQFAGADRELRSAASTLGQFTTQYLQREGDYSADERVHYIQLTGALSEWGKHAPLGDARRAKVAIPRLVSAARLTGLAGEDRFGKLGMDRSLRRLGPFFGRFKRVLTGYDLDLDAALASVRVSVSDRGADTARLRLRYTFAGRMIDAPMPVQRIDGQWYLADAVRHAQARADAPAAANPVLAAAPPR